MTDRRAQIIAATIDVVAERGVEGLTHRAVADRAGVPLGSTTYYFATLDDMLIAALQQATRHYRRQVRMRTSRFRPGDDLVEMLTDLLVAYLRPRRRSETIVEYEMCLAAMRRPALRETARESLRVPVDALTPLTDPVTAKALAAVIDGILIQSLTAGESPQPEEIAAVLRRVLAS